MRLLAIALFLFSGCATETPWKQTWADPAPELYRNVVTSGQVGLYEWYQKTYGKTREVVEVIYFVRPSLPRPDGVRGQAFQDGRQTFIYIAVDQPNWEKTWIHELHHARIGDSNHDDPSWATLEVP